MVNTDFVTKYIKGFKTAFCQKAFRLAPPSYICLNRDNVDYIDKKLKAKIIRERSFLRYLLKEKSKKIFCTRYNDIEINR